MEHETHEITATLMSTTVAELCGLMRCYRSFPFLRCLWPESTGATADVHIRTDANNLVITASTTEGSNAFDTRVAEGKQKHTCAK